MRALTTGWVWAQAALEVGQFQMAPAHLLTPCLVLRHSRTVSQIITADATNIQQPSPAWQFSRKWGLVHFSSCPGEGDKRKWAMFRSLGLPVISQISLAWVVKNPKQIVYKLSLIAQNISNSLSELDYIYSLKVIHNTLKSRKFYVPLSVFLFFMYFFSDFF